MAARPRGAGGRAGGGRRGKGRRRAQRKGRGPRGMTRRAFLRIGLGSAAVVAATGGAAGYAAGRVNAVERFDAERLSALRGQASSPLLERFAGLAEALPWRQLGHFPTDVEPLPSPAGSADVHLWVKREDRCSGLYGGNTVRKLEHLLAAALLANAGTLVTLGGIGTTHGLAAALHGRELGLGTRLAVFDQPVTPYVRENLRALAATGARVSFAAGELRAARQARMLYEQARDEGAAPHFLMMGGWSRLGTVGHVTAGLELAEQVGKGLIPEPDRIFVALGSGGTAAGLAAGCRLAGLKSRVTAVRVAPAVIANAFTIHYLANDALRWLRSLDPAVGAARVRFGDFDVVTDQLGAGYGYATPASEEAVAWAANDLALETACTGKALAACLRYCERRARPGETVLFWNTFSSARLVAGSSLDALPPRLREIARGRT